MAPSTPQVNENKLVIAADSETPFTLDTPEWFDWLESATTFAFNGSSGNFIARKEARARGGWYWKAYYTVQGTLHRAYLGRSSDLTLDRLNSAAAQLTSTASVGVPKNSSVQTSTLAASSGATSALPSDLLGTKLIVPPARTQLVSRPACSSALKPG